MPIIPAASRPTTSKGSLRSADCATRMGLTSVAFGADLWCGGTEVVIDWRRYLMKMRSGLHRVTPTGMCFVPPPFPLSPFELRSQVLLVALRGVHMAELGPGPLVDVTLL